MPASPFELKVLVMIIFGTASLLSSTSLILMSKWYRRGGVGLARLEAMKAYTRWVWEPHSWIVGPAYVCMNM